MRQALFVSGLCLGFLLYELGDGHANRMQRAELENAKLQTETWLQAHKARDEQDMKIRQDMVKILNRLEMMGVPRSKPAQ